MDSFFKDTLSYNRAFSEMLRPAKEQVKHLSPDNIAQRSGAVFHKFENPHCHFLDMSPAYYELKKKMLTESRKKDVGNA